MGKTIQNKQMTGLIIAAGLSSRMGSFKPLKLFEDKPFIFHIIEKLSEVCTKIVIVSGFKADILENAIREKYKPESGIGSKIEIIRNKSYASGMFSSLTAGVSALRSSSWIVYHLADQPHLPLAFYRQLPKQPEYGYNWVQPQYHGKSGHPVILGGEVILAIRSGKYNSLREIRTQPFVKIKYWETGWPQILEDFDSPDDLLKIEKNSIRETDKL